MHRLYLTIYHVGLFLALFLGQIGVRARKSGYFDYKPNRQP